MASTINASTSAGLVSTADTSGVLQLQTAGTAAVTVDASQNVGIGTTSPSQKLHLSVAGATGVALRIQNSAGNTYLSTQADGHTELSAADASGYITFMSGGGTERMRLNSSGNLGLGVTPSAWDTGASVKALQVGNAASLWSYSTTNAYVGANEYWNGANRIYLNTAPACEYGQENGVHIWKIAPSGTAGNAITFTQAMTLDASGNLGVGVTSINQTGAGAARVVSIGGTNQAFVEYIGATGSGIVTGSLHRNASALVGGIYVENNTGNQGIIEFNTNNGTTYAERARIDASGNLLVGTTSYSSAPNPGISIAGSGVVNIGNNAGGSGWGFVTFNRSGTAIGSITQNGTTAVLYNTTSDQRLKENIVDAPEFGSVIDSIKVRSYDWKSDGNHQRAGFVAQELVTVAPEAVHQPADPEEMMAVDYSKLVPMLVKEIQSLRIRITQLENKL
jgi:hypothetical protein